MNEMEKIHAPVPSAEQASAIFASALATVLASFYLLARSGFNNPPLPVLNVLSVSYFIILFPGFFRTASRSSGRFRRWYQSEASLSLSAVGFVLLAGVLSHWWQRPLSLLFNIAGGAFFVICWIDFLRRGTIARLLLPACGLALLCIAVAKMAWATSLQNPLFIEEIAIRRAHIDTLYHSAISSILQTYGVRSTGLDLLVPLSYHIGSHWVFAQCASLLHMPPVLFYQLGYPVIFVPLFFHALVMFAVDLRRGRQRGGDWDLLGDRSFWIVLTFAVVGFFPPLVSSISFVNNSTITSESYCLSLTLAFVIGSLLLRLDVPPAARPPASQLVLLALFPVLLAAVTVIKVSTGLLLFGLLGYLFIRLRMYRNGWSITAILLTGVVCLMAYGWVKPTGTETVAKFPFHFIHSYVIAAAPGVPAALAVGFFLLFHYFWSWSYLAVRIRRQEGSFFVRWRELMQGKHLDLEAVVVLAAAGFLPGAFMVIQGGSAVFFSDLQNWLSLPLFLSLLSPPSPEATAPARSGFRRALVVGAGALALSLFALNAMLSLRALVVDNLYVRYSLLNCDDAKTAAQKEFARLRGSLASSPSAAAAEVATSFGYLRRQPFVTAREDQRYRLVNTLLSLQEIPLQERRRSLLYIPKTNRIFWEMLTPKSVPFLAPALSGIAMVNGEPELADAVGYGYEAYDLRKSGGADATIAELRSLLAPLGFKRLIVMDSSISVRTFSFPPVQ